MPEREPELITLIRLRQGSLPQAEGLRLRELLALKEDLRWKWRRLAEQLDAPSPGKASANISAESIAAFVEGNLTAEEQYALAIADGPIDSLRLLEQQCLLDANEDGYRYTSEILRRFVRRQQVSGLIQAGPFVIDQQRHQVWGHGQEMGLTTSQFAILVSLCQNAGQVVHGDDLETAVWGDVLVDDPDRLKTLIKRLRRAIAPFDTWIISERGVGYALRPPESQ